MEKFLPNDTNEVFLNQCYQAFLAREADAGGLEYFQSLIAGGMTREAVIQLFLSSDEFVTKFNNGNLRKDAGATGKAQKFAADGHFYSPVPAVDDYRAHFDTLTLPDATPAFVNEAGQMELAEKFKSYYAQLPFPKDRTESHRYFLNNGAFNYFDGIMLYSFIRHFKPQCIIEVGSGYSSAAMIDTCELFLERKTDITFIEPYPATLYQCLLPQDRERYTIIEKNVQDVPPEAFQKLRKNDILFIDSSHVSKFGSDVNHLLFNVIPTLQEGVVIHFHDIFKNFDYPKEWLEEGRAWNEGYLLHAFLANNQKFKILFFNDWFADKHWNFLEENLPLCTVQPAGSPFKNCGVSLWVQITA